MTENLTPELIAQLDAAALAAPPLPAEFLDRFAGLLASPTAETTAA